MGYCDKITSEMVYKMTETELNKTLDNCENCDRYYQCDTVALMNDELKLKQGECLKCPYCEHYQDYSDCPDLFQKFLDNSKAINEQYDLLLELNDNGFNIVKCNYCGQVFIHKV